MAKTVSSVVVCSVTAVMLPVGSAVHAQDGVVAGSIGPTQPDLMSYGELGIAVNGRRLFDQNVAAAAYDAAQDLIWFVSGGKLEVIDLRARTIAPVVIARNFPEQAFAIDGVSDVQFNALHAGVYPVVVVGPRPRVREGAGAYSGIWPEQDAEKRKLNKKIALVGRAWLRRQQSRKPRAAGARKAAEMVKAARKKLARVKLPARSGQCEQQDLCGTAKAFGATSYQLVTTEHTCGDACHTSCVLFDPVTGKFASPRGSSWSTTASAGPCVGYGINELLGKYFIEDRVCSIDATGTSCVDTADGRQWQWAPFGWLDPDGPALP